MQNATITVVLGVDARPNQLEALAREAQTRGAHLIVLLLSETPAVPVYSMGVGELSTYSLPAGWQADVDAAREAVEKQRAEFSLYLTDQGASADVRAVCGDASALRNTVARAGLTCDAVLIGTDLREDKRLFEDIVHAALFESAAPVLLNTAQAKVALTRNRSSSHGKRAFPPRERPAPLCQSCAMRGRLPWRFSTRSRSRPMTGKTPVPMSPLG
ncbi:hypothetical protein [Sulfitobacter faviae]|uniref:hypothetical protein n=1 Tax=Sulfitobacter faviae TaxID=1775881 RepID=UPI0024560849|nr:hypothetical protein [Sulfitobacter faviae]